MKRKSFLEKLIMWDKYYIGVLLSGNIFDKSYFLE